MRRSARSIAVFSLTVSTLAFGEATRTLRVTLSGDAKAPFAVENLAGRMTVVAGDGDAVVAVATVHAESEALASAMRFEQVRDEDGLPTLRVIYPLDRERRIRYPEAGDDGADTGRTASTSRTGSWRLPPRTPISSTTDIGCGWRRAAARFSGPTSR